MSRLKQIDPDQASGKAKDLLGEVKAKLGLVPNMTRVMANSAAVLEGYLGLSGALSKGILPAKTREQIALAVAQANGCDYCLAAHSALGKMRGLSAEQISDSRLGVAVDSKTNAMIRFARQIVDERGDVSEIDIDQLRAVGFEDDAIAEVVANVALSIFTNYFNIIAATDIDFPKATSLTTQSAATA